MNKNQFARLCKQATEAHNRSGTRSERHHNNNGETSEQAPPQSVTEMLHQMRQRNPSSFSSKPVPQGYVLSAEISAYGFIDEEVLGALRVSQEVAVTQRAPGPAAPPSWRPAFYKARYRRTLAQQHMEKKARTLEGQAMNVLANNLDLFVIERSMTGDQKRRARRVAGMFRVVPTHLKEQILLLASIRGRLNDQTIALFEDESLRSLNIGASSVSVAGLRTLIPKLSPPRGPKGGLLDDWEDIARETTDHNNNDDDDDDDSDDENSRGGVRMRGCPNLEELVLSFSLRLEGISLSLLLVEHWQSLKVLLLTGCFTMTDGPPALRILSEGLPSLVVLDLTECFWVTTRLITEIEWTTNLTRLETLRLVGCQFVERNLEPKIQKLASRTTLAVVQ